MQLVRDEFKTSLRRKHMKREIKQLRSQQVSDLYINDGPSDGESDFDEELEYFLLEMKNKLETALNSDRNDLLPLVKTIKNKLIEESYVYGQEFKQTGVLSFLIKLLEEDIQSQAEFVSDIFEVLGMISVSPIIRQNILEFNERFIDEVVAKYLTQPQERFTRNMFYFLANFIGDADCRDTFVTQTSYFNYLQYHNILPSMTEKRETCLEYLRFLSNLINNENGRTLNN